MKLFSEFQIFGILLVCVVLQSDSVGFDAEVVSVGPAILFATMVVTKSIIVDLGSRSRFATMDVCYCDRPLIYV